MLEILWAYNSPTVQFIRVECHNNAIRNVYLDAENLFLFERSKCLTTHRTIQKLHFHHQLQSWQGPILCRDVWTSFDFCYLCALNLWDIALANSCHNGTSSNCWQLSCTGNYVLLFLTNNNNEDLFSAFSMIYSECFTEMIHILNHWQPCTHIRI